MCIRFIPLPEVREICSLSKSSIYAKIKDGTFPAPVNVSKRAVRWPSNAIDDWVEQRINDSSTAV